MDANDKKKTTMGELCDNGTMEEHFLVMNHEYHPITARYNQDDVNLVHSIAWSALTARVRNISIHM